MILIDELDSFRIEADKMSAKFLVFSALTGIDAIQVGIGTVNTLSKGDTDFWNRNIARITNAKKILAFDIMFTAL